MKNPFPEDSAYGKRFREATRSISYEPTDQILSKVMCGLETLMERARSDAENSKDLCAMEQAKCDEERAAELQEAFLILSNLEPR